MNSTKTHESDSEEYQARILFNEVKNPDGWKLPVLPVICGTEALADKYAEAIIFFVGGAEITPEKFGREIFYRVTSKGYYHYIGA